MEGFAQNVDFIAGIVRQEFTSVYHIEDIKAVVEQQTDRLAKMLMKSGKISAGGFFLLLRVLSLLANAGTEDDFDQMLGEAVSMGVDYMQKKTCKSTVFCKIQTI